ncbi:MAG: ATP-binding protein [Acidobacteriota bacterium]|nr:ATP-binding protein [Acidobacteriota bacterium]
MAQQFGDFRPRRKENQEYLTIGFSPESLPIQERRRNKGLSADFLGDYLSSFFPGDEKEARFKREEVRSGVSYIANELLENAMKYNYGPANAGIEITMELDPGEIRFYVSNSVGPDDGDAFKALIHRLLTGEPGELLVEQLERNAEEDAEEGSGLGYLTMLNDYKARLAWAFEEMDGWQSVTTLVRLPV